MNTEEASQFALATRAVRMTDPDNILYFDEYDARINKERERLETFLWDSKFSWTMFPITMPCAAILLAYLGLVALLDACFAGDSIEDGIGTFFD